MRPCTCNRPAARKTFATEAEAKRRNLAALNLLEEMNYVRNYCNAHPSEGYTHAVRKLWFELPKLAPRDAASPG